MNELTKKFLDQQGTGKVILSLLAQILNVERNAVKISDSSYVRLDETGRVPASLLPSYVDDMLEFGGFVNVVDDYTQDRAEIISGILGLIWNATVAPTQVGTTENYTILKNQLVQPHSPNFNLKGYAVRIIDYGQSGGYPQNPNEGDVVLYNNDSNDDIDVYQNGSWEGYPANIGDGYVIDNQLYVKVANESTASRNRWEPRGDISTKKIGDNIVYDGITYHITAIDGDTVTCRKGVYNDYIVVFDDTTDRFYAKVVVSENNYKYYTSWAGSDVSWAYITYPTTGKLYYNSDNDHLYRWVPNTNAPTTGNMVNISQDELLKMFDVDELNGWLKVNGPTKNYIVPLTELIKPAAPSISTVVYDVVINASGGGNVSVSVTNNQAGSSISYYVSDSQIQDEASITWEELTGNISIPSGFVANNNKDKTKYIYTKATLNGVDSNVTETTITIRPKVSAPSLSVSSNDNGYATSVNISISPSVTAGAKSEYTVNGTDQNPVWSEFTETLTFTEDATFAAGKYKVRATRSNYQASAVNSNSATTLNKKKVYYGYTANSKTTLANVTDITSLIGGGSIKSTKPAINHKYDLVPTAAGQLLWICCVDAITNLNSIFVDAADVVPIGFIEPSENTVSGWHCYRMADTAGVSADVVANGTSFYIKNV